MVLLNAALVGCILSLAALLALSINGAPALVPHVAFLLCLAAGLLFLINWCAAVPVAVACISELAGLH